LIRLLSAHPEITGLVLASVSSQGESIASLYPNCLEICPGHILVSPEDLISRSHIVFGALPAGTGEPYARACFDRGISYIDLSADFRFDDDEDSYRLWYGKSWEDPELHTKSIYGLPELNRNRIKELAGSGPVIIGNPGFYPTAICLSCYPALAVKNNKSSLRLKPVSIIADAVSGVTGAGREPGRAYHFPECSDSVSAYKVGAHRHIPEISRTIAKMAGRSVPLIFTPHLGPFNRGILATVYLHLEDTAGMGSPGGELRGPAACTAKPKTKEIVGREGEIREQYATFYKDEPFVRILPDGVNAATNRVRLSNYCDISVHLDHGGTVLIVESAIDNMVKGAAGQAVQNMNIIFGFEETTGLNTLPALF
jgi:N-acetyl-gamma-glutamyl-phosphate reductase